MGKITGLACLLLVLPALCFAQPKYCLSSGTKAVAGGNIAISSVPAKLCGVIIDTNGTDNANIEVWDSPTTNIGVTCLFNMTVTGGDNRGGAMFPLPIAAQQGLYLDFNSCTECSAEVYYQP